VSREEDGDVDEDEETSSFVSSCGLCALLLFFLVFLFIPELVLADVPVVFLVFQHLYMCRSCGSGVGYQLHLNYTNCGDRRPRRYR